MWTPNMLGIKALQGNVLVTAYMIVCGIAFIMFGYDQAVLGALSGNPSFLEHMGVSDYSFSWWNRIADLRLDHGSPSHRVHHCHFFCGCHSWERCYTCVRVSFWTTMAHL